MVTLTLAQCQSWTVTLRYAQLRVRLTQALITLTDMTSDQDFTPESHLVGRPADGQTLTVLTDLTCNRQLVCDVENVLKIVMQCNFCCSEL